MKAVASPSRLIYPLALKWLSMASKERPAMELKSSTLFVCALGVSFALVASAQQRQTKDPQSSYEPRSTPGEGQKYLQRFVGTWEVTKTFYPRSGSLPSLKGNAFNR